MEIKDLETDFEDGLKLLALLEVLSSKNVGRYNKRPKMAVQKLENVAIALKFIKSEGMKLVNIGKLCRYVMEPACNVGPSCTAHGFPVLLIFVLVEGIP